MSNTNHHGFAIKNLFKDKNRSVSSLVVPTGRSRQQIHNDFNRVTIKSDVLEIYATALNMTSEEIFKIVNQDSDQTSSNYLIEHLEHLEEQFKQLLHQLEVKDKQIEVKDKQLELKDKQLEKLIDILGKHKDVLHLAPESVFQIAA